MDKQRVREAIKMLRKERRECKEGLGFYGGGRLDAGLLKKKIEACNTAIEALEKQLSKKPKENGMYRGIFKKIKAYTCPTCGNCCLEEMINERQNTDFCWNCGQRLDWSEQEVKE